ncbi:sulfatase-like hydrolase/transferase [Halorubrum sp. CBA1229]|uniref:sulfatase-like hydrolase/transferase n=1 Tax=Halorubrum sp. CBA1229 TaxID=1853699 RepID=UPI000F415970|nr:sulfatase-like hydrolase/transferase [Halorubrum sp. CBA1229]QKY15553.1 sulfatase-like hydrolase/transferase [Halorubrum sp. CBA1229]
MTRNIVLLCLDTVRYDYFNQHADDLDALVDHSFEECRTASTWSVPSHASMFTEILPHQHGFHSATPAFGKLGPEDTFLSNLDGFQCVGVSANPYASPIFGFDELFDEFYHVESSMPWAEGLSPSKFWHESSTDGWTRYLEFLASCVQHSHPLKSLGNGIASQTEKLFQKLPLPKPFDDGCKRILSRTRHVLNESEQPTFVFVNIMDAHGPLTNVHGYDQSLIADDHRNSSPDISALSMNMDKTFDEHELDIAAYRDLYAAAVEYTARQVAQFCERLADDTAVVITADHGEQLGETTDERRFGHVTPDMSEALVHVPLEVVNADLSLDESAPISHLDLGKLVTAIATGTEFERESPIAVEVAGLGVAHPPTDHQDFDYWNRVSRCAYINSGCDKYVWNSHGEARHYERTNGEYVLKHKGDFERVPANAKVPFTTDIKDVSTNNETTDVNSAVESQLEELGYL